MVDIKVPNGLDIPIVGAPEPVGAGGVESLPPPREISLNLYPFADVKFKLLARAGDVCKRGEPLVYDKKVPERKFVAPASGKVKEVRRGLKRRLLDIVIEVDPEGEELSHPSMSVTTASRDDIIARLLEGGAFAHIRHRPLDLLANPAQTPRAIFVNAASTAPFTPPANLQVQGHEEEFQQGLSALAKLTSGAVYLVRKADNRDPAFLQAKDVEVHSVEGAHPAGNVSLHIQNIAPIQRVDDVVWTIDVNGVITVGALLNKGNYYTDRVISIAGPGVVEGKRGYVRGKAGHPIGALVVGRNDKGLQRMISGDLLMGHKVGVDDFLHFYDTVFTVIPESVSREFLHFFRLGLDKYSASRAYLSGHQKPGSHLYPFTTSQHGEHRGIVDGRIYESVLPLPVPVLPLIRAIQGNDLEAAEELGLLEVAPEDFALPAFICPSKTEMVSIVQRAQQKHAAENIH